MQRLRLQKPAGLDFGGDGFTGLLSAAKHDVYVWHFNVATAVATQLPSASVISY